MNIRKIYSIGISILLGMLLLTQYTNCSTSPELEQALREASDGGEVRIVDDYNPNPIAFVQSNLELDQSQVTTEVFGFCQRDQYDKLLYWAVYDAQNDQLMAEGESLCERGGFKISLQDVVRLDCESHHEVYVETEVGDHHDRMGVYRVCAN